MASWAIQERVDSLKAFWFFESKLKEEQKNFINGAQLTAITDIHSWFFVGCALPTSVNCYETRKHPFVMLSKHSVTVCWYHPKELKSR